MATPQTLFHVLGVLLSIAIPLASFAVGLRYAGSDPFWLLRRPGLLARSLLAVLIVAPVAGVAFLQTIDVAAPVRAGLTIAILSIGIGPIAAFSRTRGEHALPEYEVALNSLLLVLAIGYLPLAIAVHGAIFHHGLSLGAGQVARVVLLKALLPLAAGVLAGRVRPRVVDPARKVIGLLEKLVQLIVVVVALAATWRALLSLGARAWLASAAVVLGELVIGHVAGGPERDTRRTLAAFSAMRFPALALLLVGIVPNGRALVPVVVSYVISGVVLTGLYSALVARAERHGSAGGGRARPASPPTSLGDRTRHA
jgi:BASS family bile acid:Na+ symporter